MAAGERVREAGLSLFGYFARHPTAANLLMVLMVAFGALGLSQIRSQFFPDVVVNEVRVTVAWDGAGPEDVDAGVVALIEPALMAVEGVTASEATSRTGLATLDLEFEPDWDMGRAAAEVEAALAGAPALPEGAEAPEVRRLQWRDRVTDVVIHGPVAAETLGRYADEFVARLYREGVTRASIRGVPDPVIAIEAPGAALARHGLSLREIADAVEEHAAASPAGEAEGGVSRLRAGAERRDPAAIGEVTLRSDADGGKLRISDIASIDADGGQSGAAYFIGGNPAVAVRVDRADGGDAIAVQAATARVAAEMQATLPEGVMIELTRSRAENITDRLELLVGNGLMGLALVVGLLFLFLSARAALWVAAGIPVAMLAAVGFMYAAGLTLNMISLFGLILCLGLVVDDAIVVAEHADWRRRALGEAPATAAERAARAMALPVFTAMVTTVLAFYALTFIGGRYGRLIGDIPFTVIVVLAASLVECFLILPHHMAGALARDLRRGWIDAPSRAVNRGLDAFRRRVFLPMMGWVIKLRYPVVAAAILLVAQSAAMVLGGDVAWRFFSSPERSSVTGNIAMLPGATRADTEAMVRELERAAAAVDAEFARESGVAPIASALAQVGGTAGRGLSGEDVKDPDQLGAIDIELVDPDLRPYSSAEFLAALEEEVTAAPLLETLSFRSWGEGPGGDALDVAFYGADARALKAAAEALKASLAPMAAVSGLEDSLAYDKTELVLELTPLGQRLGFSIDAVGAELFARLSGVEAAEFADGPRTRTVRVTLPEAERGADFLERTRLRAPDGALVGLAEIVTLESRPGFSKVERVDGRRMARVTGAVADSDPAAAAAVTRALETTILPQIAAAHGVDYAFDGLVAEERAFLGDALGGFAFCLAGIYLALAWVFASWFRPLVVMAVIPLGLIGTIWGHYRWDMAMSIFTVVGLVGMSGIIINNAIVLIATVDARGVGRATTPAVIAAAGDRLRPILLTSATTVLGLAPLLFERSQQALFLKPTVITLVYGLGVGRGPDAAGRAGASGHRARRTAGPHRVSARASRPRTGRRARRAVARGHPGRFRLDGALGGADRLDRRSVGAGGGRGARAARAVARRGGAPGGAGGARRSRGSEPRAGRGAAQGLAGEDPRERRPVRCAALRRCAPFVERRGAGGAQPGPQVGQRLDRIGGRGRIAVDDVAAALLEAVEALLPDLVGPAQGEPAARRVVFGGEERSEAAGVVGLAQGRQQEPLGQLAGRDVAAQELGHMSAALVGARDRCSGRRGRVRLVVGGDRGADERQAAAGAQFGGRGRAMAVGEGDVVGHVRRHAREHCKRRLQVAAGLQQVAQDMGDAEARRGLGAAAVGQRHGEAAGVDAVREAPEELDHAHDRGSGPFAAQEQALVEVGREVVVAHEAHLAGVGAGGDRAAAEVARRRPAREEARGAVRSASAHGQAAVDRGEFGHVPGERRLAGGAVGAGVAAARHEPGLVVGPGARPAFGPLSSRSRFRDGVEPEGWHGHRGLPSRKKRIISAEASGPAAAAKEPRGSPPDQAWPRPSMRQSSPSGVTRRVQPGPASRRASVAGGRMRSALEGTTTPSAVPCRTMVRTAGRSGRVVPVSPRMAAKAETTSRAQPAGRPECTPIAAKRSGCVVPSTAAIAPPAERPAAKTRWGGAPNSATSARARPARIAGSPAAAV